MNESLEITVQEKVQELIQKDKILKVQSKQAVMGEMISMIAHQWRQPLSTITLQISNLQIKRLLGETDENPHDIDVMLNQISDTIIYLSETIDDFQTYFRTDKESMDIEIHELLQKAVNFALPRIKTQKIALTIHKHSEIITRVYINELVQVILNLINNAIDSYERLEREDKHIDLEVLEMQEDIICIIVKDNGCGIAPDNLEHLFEPYFSTKGKNGTGLGLYMSQMIIEKQFYGHIEVESSHEGSTFSVFLHKEI
jgi:signal transduction histidine kinase